MKKESTGSVIVALGANAIVTVAKFVAFAISGSSAMLSEAIHSVGDTANQSLLLVGLERSKRPADLVHPLGYGRERFFWGLVSALGIFFVGAGVTFMHGVEGITDPHPVHYGVVTWIVLALSFVLEGIGFVNAVRGSVRGAHEKGTTFFKYVREGQDPTELAVILEDGAAVLGVVLVAGCVGMAEITGDPVWDGVGSLLVAFLLAFVALFLVATNRRYLLTKAIDEDVQRRVREVLESHAIVEKVSELEGTVVGLDDYRIAADIDFDGRHIAKLVTDEATLAGLRRAADKNDDALRHWLAEYAEKVVERLGDEVGRLEKDLKEAVPEAQHLDFEQD
ncbi:MAG: cation diffusion facilitator family transporter [Myxococcales bacterium]|nr:cation diffusion facilitator family transporter [Myxococcales bacterium]MCB9731569.1 cation diffusion facilitator family transporter [Deltaproteobacteria bacterium]